MEFKTIAYNSPEYKEMVDLRYRILREPLGLTFSEEDLVKDKNDILLAAYFPKSEKIVACCILTPLNEFTVQLRQMAVDDFYQRKGFGSEMLNFAEQKATQQDFKYMYLHARQVAANFYKKHGYSIESDRFTEVGIPHFEMLKYVGTNK